MAEPADQDRLSRFISEHWSASHVFVHRPDVFVWQHLDEHGRFNMVLAEDTGASDDSVLGVLGFIPMGRFSPSLGDADLMLAIWKVRDDVAPPGLGLRLLKFLRAECDPRSIGAIGTSEMVRRIYQVLRYEVGTMDQAAIFNPDRRGSLRIARGVPDAAFRSDPGVSPAIELRALDASTPASVQAQVDRLGADVIPVKNWQYLERRFLGHPWYRYEVRAVHHGNSMVAVVVWRAVEANGAVALRIVDVIGAVDWLAEAEPVLRRLVIDCGAEYIDLVHWGIDPSLLVSGGFVSPHDATDFVLPNYFEPFEARNIEIGFAHKVFDGDPRPVRLFRADSDQDRPNLVDAEVRP
jgi:hypothetical protein